LHTVLAWSLPNGSRAQANDFPSDDRFSDPASNFLANSLARGENMSIRKPHPSPDDLFGDGALGAPRGLPRTTQANSRAAPRSARRQGCFAYRTGNDRFPHTLAKKLWSLPSVLADPFARAGFGKLLDAFPCQIGGALFSLEPWVIGRYARGGFF
jgi:hypothetical protein